MSVCAARDAISQPALAAGKILPAPGAVQRVLTASPRESAWVSGFRSALKRDTLPRIGVGFVWPGTAGLG